MAIDLLSSSDRFSKLKILIDKNYPIEDEEFEALYALKPVRIELIDFQCNESQVILIIEKHNFLECLSLKDRYANLYLMTFDHVPEIYGHKIFELSKNPKEVWKILELIEHLIEEQNKLNISKMAQRHCAEIFKDANRFLMDRKGENSMMISIMIETFLNFNNELFKENNVEKFIFECEGYFRELHLWKILKLATIEEVLELKNKYSKGKVFPLDWLGLKHFLFYEASDESEGISTSDAISFAISLLLEWLEKYVGFHPKSSQVDQKYSLWEEALAKIPLPLALINLKGDLIVYNQAFTKLNLSPKECLQIKNEETVEINGVFFKLNKIKIEKNDRDSSLFLFYNQDTLNSKGLVGQQNFKNIPSQELGIISSSIAHELNNPLAGILAAIGVLELEQWDEEEEEALVEMKTSAKRCKSLVEIFLGFSRTRDQEQKEEPIRNALGQSLDLLRFRMIESDVRIEVDIENSSEPFKRYINLSLCSMILYLILGDVLTLFNHLRLISGDQSLKVLKTIYKEERDRVVLTFNQDIEFSQKLISSKLIQYLAEVQGLEIDVDHNKIIISDWKLI